MRSKLYTYVVTLILIVGAMYMGYGQSPPPPAIPPPGLQVPIDDYIPHLLILGVFIGGYFFYKTDCQKVTNS